MVDIARALIAYKKNQELTFRYMLIGGLVALVTAPIPGTSFLLLGLEIAMIVQFVSNYGGHFRIEVLDVILGVCISPFVLGLKAFAGILGFIPVIGWLFKGFVAATVVLIIGLSANYILKPTGPDVEEYLRNIHRK